MSKITSVSELQNYCTQFYALRGYTISHMALPLDEYLAIADEVFSNIAYYSSTPAPAPQLDSIEIMMPSAKLKVIPLSYDGKTMLGHKGVLEEYVRKNVSGFGSYVELRLGVFRYGVTHPATPVALNYGSVVPTTQPTGTGIINTGPTSATQIQYGLYKPPADTEPECACDSKQLASTGHDNGCAWINWKRGKK